MPPLFSIYDNNQFTGVSRWSGHTPDMDYQIDIMEQKTVKEIIGRNLKKFRLRANKSQVELGDLIGCSGSQISNVEAGKNQLDAADFYMACIALGITPAHLFPADNEIPEDLAKLKKRMAFESLVRETEQLNKEYLDKLKEAERLKKELESWNYTT